MNYLATFKVGERYMTRFIEAENFFHATHKLAEYTCSCIDLRDFTIISLVKL